MMLKTGSRSRLLLVPLLLLLGACATNRSTLSLQTPAEGTFVTGTKTALIESVSDNRRFEEDPDEPSTPSLKKGDKYVLDANGRSKAIARKRNGYGMAIGDIMLEGDATVESLTRELLEKGLRQRGYRIVARGEAAPQGTLVLRAGIDEFWAWFTPGVWAATIEARVRTTIEASSGSGSAMQVVGHGENSVQSGRDLNWQEAYERAFVDYMSKLDSSLKAAGH